MRTVETVSTLNRLIRTCRDAEQLCETWGRTAESAHLRNRFGRRSQEWGRQGDELQALVLLLGGEPETAATLAARAQCLWVACRSAVAGRRDAPGVDGCERAQQRALRRYEQALSGYLPERIRRTVSQQAERISARCDRIGAGGAHFAAP